MIKSARAVVVDYLRQDANILALVDAKVTNAFKSKKSVMDRDIKFAVVKAQKDYLKSRGFKVK